MIKDEMGPPVSEPLAWNNYGSKLKDSNNRQTKPKNKQKTMERQSGQISTAFQHNHAQTNQKSMWQSILFVNKRISDKCFEMNAVIQHTVHGSSWNCSASLKGDLVTQGTKWGEHWSFSPSFCTNSWLMWWVWSSQVLNGLCQVCFVSDL